MDTSISVWAIPGIKNDFRIKSIRKASGTEIIELICEYFSVPIEKVVSKCRKRLVVYARDWCIWFLIEYTHKTLKEIGGMVDGRDHTTCIHSREKVEKNLIDSNYTGHDKYTQDHAALTDILNKSKTVRDFIEEQGMTVVKLKSDDIIQITKGTASIRVKAVYSNPSFM